MVEPGATGASKPGMLIFEQRPSLTTLAAGLPEFVLGAIFLSTWIDPTRFGVGWVGYAMQMMLIEFILTHAGAFLGWRAIEAGSARERMKVLLGFGAIYATFGVGLSLALHSWGPVVVIVGFTTSRVWVALYEPPPTEVARRWFGMQVAINALLYLGLAAMTVFAPLPELGVKSWMFESTSDDPGLWEKEPHLVVAMASVFYLVRGWLTMDARPRRVNLAAVQVD